jgi:thioredoxin reductase (NADPH)
MKNLSQLSIQNQKTDDIFEMKIDGVFIFIGYVPNTGSLEGIIKLNEQKEIIVDENMKTSIDGIYAAGDSIHKRFRQVTTAVADGTIAALAASEYINEFKKEIPEPELV